MIKIYPSILTDSVEVLQKEATSIQSSKLFNILQIDVVDGIYADNFTLTPVSVLDLNLPAKWQLDFHLMVEEPMDYLIEIFDHPKKGSVRALIAQIEKMSHQVDYLEEVKKHGFKAGLSLDLYTPIQEIEEDAWDSLDIIQVMGIEAGFQGQKFSDTALKKIETLKLILATRKQQIELVVDGGVKIANLAAIIKAGVDSVTVGSQLWQSDNPNKILEQMSGDI